MVVVSIRDLISAGGMLFIGTGKMKLPLSRWVCTFVCFALYQVAPCRADDVFLFCYFERNGEDGLHLAWSKDGLAWEALNEGRSFLLPRVGTKEKLMRDPCIARGPDATFHMVWTSGWWERGIGYASSRNLVDWSEQREIPVMAHEPSARNCWAPEIVWDPAEHEYMIFWATTIPGRFESTEGSSESELNHRMYFTTTRDFQSFAPTRLFYDPGFSVIDATFVVVDDKPHLIVKDETRHPPKKYLLIATAKSFRGPFGQLSEPISPLGIWVEGPTAIQTDRQVLLYFDAYQTKHYGVLRASVSDLTRWEDISGQLRMPGDRTDRRVRHGTVLRVERHLLSGLGVPAGD